ncbi:MAG: TonB-dependent receptor [Flavobacteriaceae bacterium]|nr:TonB-dependent receptor [Flavobacteriaceae bacterium]
MRTVLLLFFVLLTSVGYSQTVVKGKVVDEENVPVPGANIVVEGTKSGTNSDFDGNFVLNTTKTPPFTLVVSSLGYTSKKVQVARNNQNLNIVLASEQTLLDEIVVSASRTPERIFESPVTVERFGIEKIKNTASADFYDGLENLKGVDINTNSLTFKAINTRGFATFANTRFMQLVDGMDNSTPALNFPMGNLLGMVETDVLSVELLPGAASALYGANAFNGILFMRSKNPFDYEGVSGYIKQGITSQEAAGDNNYTDLGVRLAKKFTKHFAMKANFGYLKGTDWIADNRADKLVRGFTRQDPDYDGINVYGDEVSTNIRAASGGLGIVPDVNVSRTGYAERELTDYTAESMKADMGIYLRPWADDFEISYQGKYGKGTTIYQGANRYSIKNFFQHQQKIELRNDNFFVRAYMTEDKAKDSYDMVFTGININRFWKPDKQWFEEYVQTFIGASISGLGEADAHAAARAAADTGRLIPGTPEFQTAIDQVTSDADFSKGSQFKDNSKFFHVDANYNLSHLWNVVEIQVGGSYRKYRLNSFGTIYTDTDSPIEYSEVGVYTQLQKKLEFSDEMSLKLTGSLRYDKSELFDGFFSPRLSAGLSINRDHNIRASVQTGFRNPTTQDLYIGLDVGRAILVGAARNNPERDVRTLEISDAGVAAFGLPKTIQKDGTGAYNNSFLASSVRKFLATGNEADLQVANSEFVKPEQVTSFEVGYRGRVEGVTIDLSGYYNRYKDFLSNETVTSPLYGNVIDGNTSAPSALAISAITNEDFQDYQTYTNTDNIISSYGASIGVNTKVLGGFDLSANYTYAKLDKDDNPDFRTNFNTPEHKVKASFGKTELFKNFGFNVSWRWSDTYLWEASFADGQIPAFHVMDAQINYKVPSLKSQFKAGATNLLGDEYFTAIGTGYIGSQFYVSWVINNL